MSEDEVVRMVNEVFRDSFEIEPDRLQPQAEIFRDLGLDSLDMVDLVVALQKKFGVQLHSNPEVRQIRSLQDLYTFIRAEQAKRKA